ncbi:DUF3995 domain-containing protein [Loktanella agnita]|uniref:DUF3995 domain-containing protein n=1 Tax=Loktanella agnita TaxID=287097 RepID=UPI0039886DB6
MMVLAILMSLILGAVALLHVFWGFGIWLPIRDEAALTRAVVGARGVTRMPGPIPCFLVALALGLVIAALWTQGWMISRIILWLAIVVFLGRGLLAYTKHWRKMTPEEPFATYDRRIYGPFCLMLAAGLALTIFGG